MPSQSSRFRKHGIYTMDVRRVGMGTLPMGTSPVPAGAITSVPSIIAPLPAGADPAQVGNGVPPGLIQVLIAAIDSAMRLATENHADASVFPPMRNLRAFLANSLTHLNADGLVPSTTVRNVLNPTWLTSDVLFWIHAAAPGVDFQQVAARIDAGAFIGSRARDAQAAADQAAATAAAQAARARQSAIEAATALAASRASADVQTQLDAQAAAQRAADAATAAALAQHEADAHQANADSLMNPSTWSSWVGPAIAAGIGLAIGVAAVRVVAG